jgi:hypothetical protein
VLPDELLFSVDDVLPDELLFSVDDVLPEVFWIVVTTPGRAVVDDVGLLVAPPLEGHPPAGAGTISPSCSLCAFAAALVR